MGNLGRQFLILLLLLGTAVVGFFYLRPAWQEFQTLRAKIDRLENLSTELDDLIANKDAIFDKIASLSKENLQKIDTMVPKGPKAADFLVSLEAIALKNGATLKSVNLQTNVKMPGGGVSAAQPRPSGGAFSASPDAKGLKELTYSFVVSAPYDKLKSFLKDLEQNLRLTDVKTMTFKSSDIKSAGDLFEANLVVATYYQ